MIRTRDVVIFSATLLFLLVCIAITILVDRKDIPSAFMFTAQDLQSTSTFSAEGDDTEINRESIIDRLRNALALNEPEVEPQPSVETAFSTTSDADRIEDETGEDMAVLSCGTDDAAQAQRTWPLRDIFIVEQGGYRQVMHELANAETVDSNATTSATSTLQTPPAGKKLLIQFPTAPVAAAEPKCVPSEIIGVTTAGSLMYNSETAFYRGYGADYLIGYARDGYPIYGYYEGEVDQCGGYMHPSGYRYTVSADKDVIVSCFTAAVAPFLIP